MNNITNILYFLILGKMACVDISCVSKILPLMELQEYLEGEKCLVGIMNYHGKSVSVIDLGLLLGMERKKDYTLNSMIMLCTNQKTTLGLLVDNMLGQHVISSDQINKIKSQANESSYIKSMVKLNNNFMMMIDINKLLANEGEL